MYRQRQAQAPIGSRVGKDQLFQPEEKLATMPVKILKDITHSKKINNARIRITGSLFILSIMIYFPWLAYHLNTQALWLSVPFVCVCVYTTILILIVIFNNWSKSAPRLFKLPVGSEVPVAILIPTYGEPVDMVQLTIESVLHQNWPTNKMVIIVGDDGHRDEMRLMTEQVQRLYTQAQIIYHLPPRKGTPERKGSAKDGNLNSMLDFISLHFPYIKYIETRDADDLVGDANFLRYTVGHLVSSPKTAYVQTIKEAKVSPGDPFGNMQVFFYREQMLSKNAANAVFPCGSGLLWRKESLDKIGGFPSWNLVEDLYSGYVAMQNGFKNTYLPIVGAVGQTAPEDIPNVYKQLGTWALDTCRIFLWKNPWIVKGLTFRQKMHFTEMGLFYMLGLPLLLITLIPAFGLVLGVQPIQQDKGNFVLHSWTYVAMFEVLFLNLGGDTSFKSLWRSREMCFGLMFVYIKACCLAILYGPNKKPAYKVTRKVQQVGLYFRETFFQILLFLLLLFAMGYHLFLHQKDLLQSDFGLLAWTLFYVILLLGFIRKSWFGIGGKPAKPISAATAKRIENTTRSTGASNKLPGIVPIPGANALGHAYTPVSGLPGQFSGSLLPVPVASPGVQMPVSMPHSSIAVSNMKTLVMEQPWPGIAAQASPLAAGRAAMDYTEQQTITHIDTPGERQIAQTNVQHKPKKQFIMPPTIHS